MSSEELVNKFKKLVMKANFEFLENKLFQPIGIELSTVPVILEVEETNPFKNTGPYNSMIPPAYYRPDTDSIYIFIEHDSFLKRESYNEKFTFLMFLLFHEASHRLFMTKARSNDRDPELWNIATDLEIHNMYYVFSEVVKTNKSAYSDFEKYCEYIDKFLIFKTNTPKELNEGLFEKEYLNCVAEEIYQNLLDSKKEFTKVLKFNFDSSSNASDEGQGKTNNDTNKDEEAPSDDESNADYDVKITISEYTLPSGKKISTSNIEFSNKNSSPKDLSEHDQMNEENSKKLRKTILENTLKDEVAKAQRRGHISSECHTFLKKLLHIKIDWVKILRNSLQSALEKSDYFSWSRPRTSLYGMQDAPYLPSQCYDFEGYGTLIVARDESGSMSDMEIAKAAGIIADAKSHYKKIIILKHDTSISEVYEIEELDERAKEILLKRSSMGGTSHKEVFEWIRDYHIKTKDSDERISCLIFITDLWSDIVEHQEIVPNGLPKIYLAPLSSTEENSLVSNIKGSIIPVEL